MRIGSICSICGKYIYTTDKEHFIEIDLYGNLHCNYEEKEEQEK